MNAMIEGLMAYCKNFEARILSAFQLSIKDRKSKWLTVIMFCLLLVVHLVVLPAHILGSDIGLKSFQNLSFKIIILAILFASLESVLITLWVYLIQHKTHCKSTPAAGGILLGLVSPLLCCTPLLPTILGFIAILFPSVVSGLGMTIQYNVNVYQNELLILALVLLLFAIAQNAPHSQ